MELAPQAGVATFIRCHVNAFCQPVGGFGPKPLLHSKAHGYPHYVLLKAHFEDLGHIFLRHDSFVISGK